MRGTDLKKEKGFDKESVTEFIKRKNIRTVQIGYADIQGVLRGKYIPSQFFIDTLDKGIPFCVVALGWDIQCEIIEGIPLSSWANGFPDFIAKADLSTFQVLPWRENTAFVMCDIFTEEGEPFPLAPRTVLKNVIAECNKMGYTPNTASEL
ncbi:MAG: glutamine synthetase, partial [Deltaproteobacteria bacterium]|nr:glutamine synthetase [Deltaproteobacteria bacterium]